MAYQRNQQQNQQQSTAIAVSDKEKTQTIIGMISSRRDAFAAVLPAHMRAILSPERLIKIVQSALSRQPFLLKCTPQSLVKCLMQSAEMGLELNGIMGEAYAVPFWNNKIRGYEATFIPGYKGLAQIAYRSGSVKKIDARVIHEGDTYDVEMGLEERLVHRPQLEGAAAKRGIIAVYAVAELTDGVKKFDLMTKAEVEAIRERSPAYRKKKNDDDATPHTPWETDYEEMAKKTVIRRLTKLLPMTPELKKAVEYDTEREVSERPRPVLDIDFLLDEEQQAEEADAEGSRGEQMADRIRGARTNEAPADPAPSGQEITASAQVVEAAQPAAEAAAPAPVEQPAAAAPPPQQTSQQPRPRPKW